MAKLERMAKSMARSQRMQATAEEIRNDYVTTLEKLTHDESEAIKPALHLRSAKKLLEIAKEYGGIFNKAAQFAASLRGPIPKEYTDTLAELTDKAPFKPFTEIDQRFQEEFGKSAKDIFAEFEETPMAAASLAQVHRARLEDGRLVAVKVQYPGLAEQIEADLEVLETLLKMFRDKLPFDMTWLLNDFRGYLRKECSFLGEAENCIKAQESFAYNPKVFVPQPIMEYCKETVLVLEFAEGCTRVNDVKWMEANGIAPLEVADLLNEISTVMVLITGYIHGDPHSGNVYVRLNPETNDVQIVVLDHGLYHELDEETRVSLCNLWKACLLEDKATKAELCKKFAGPMAHFFPLVLSQWFLDNLSLEEAADLVAGRYYQQVNLTEVADFLGGMEDQKSILGMLHSTGYTRFLLQDLGIPERRRLQAWGKAALLGTDKDVQETLRGSKDPKALAKLQKYESQVDASLGRMQGRIRWFALCFFFTAHRRLWLLFAPLIGFVLLWFLVLHSWA